MHLKYSILKQLLGELLNRRSCLLTLITDARMSPCRDDRKVAVELWFLELDFVNVKAEFGAKVKDVGAQKHRNAECSEP